MKNSMPRQEEDDIFSYIHITYIDGATKAADIYIDITLAFHIKKKDIYMAGQKKKKVHTHIHNILLL